MKLISFTFLKCVLVFVNKFLSSIKQIRPNVGAVDTTILKCLDLDNKQLPVATLTLSSTLAWPKRAPC